MTGKNKKTTIYIDGASQGNPGPAAIGIVICSDKEPVEMYKYIGTTTNNVAEYTALIYSLQEALILGIRDVVVKSDSELLVNQLNGIYKVRDLKLHAFYEQFAHLKRGFKNLKVEFIAREENVRADKLANKAIDSRLNTSLRRT